MKLLARTYPKRTVRRVLAAAAGIILAGTGIGWVVDAHADTFNMAKLQRAFPAVYAEVSARYNAPGGMLPGEGGDQ